MLQLARLGALEPADADAEAFEVSGLSAWIGSRFEVLAEAPAVGLVACVVAIVEGLTELTSNTATAALLMPIMAALSRALEVPPYLLMVPAIVSCSCAFMLPVATPPNAIVMGSGYVNARQLFAEGIRLNLTSAVMITVLTVTLGRLVLPL